MGNPFARRQMANQPTSPLPFTNQNSQDPVDYVTQMIQRSGGDARAAFYSACKEKGVDADDFLWKVRMMKNPQAEIQNMVLNNPKVKSLFSLFSLMK